VSAERALGVEDAQVRSTLHHFNKRSTVWLEQQRTTRSKKAMVCMEGVFHLLIAASVWIRAIGFRVYPRFFEKKIIRDLYQTRREIVDRD
jgi:hypothetical protein